MLLDGAVKFGKQGREGIATKNFEQAFTGLSSCREIILELLTSIRPEPNPELAANVRALYTFIYTQLIEGGHEKDLAKLDKAIELIEFERETWVMLMDKLAQERQQQREQGVAGSVMPPAQVQTTTPASPSRPALSIQG